MPQDRHRPRYHFLPPQNWMNDPNGLIFWGGEYHLFYQHNPNGPFWGTMHWGHAVSPDLVRWRHLPIALAPTPGGPDRDGCFSGCAVDDGGVPTLVYTGVQPEAQCVATSADGMVTWQKHPGNPVISGPPEGLDVTGFRDPFVWRERDEWRMVVGSGLRGVGGTVLLYRSPDLIGWQYLQPLCTGAAGETGETWECPNFFPLGNRHVLIVSPVPLRKSLYFVGRYDGARFTPERHGVLDAGGHYYAPLSLLDAAGRRVIFGWLWEGRSDAGSRAAGWAGVQSLPRVLTLGADGDLHTEPLPELSTLRGECRRYHNLSIPPGGVPLDVAGDRLEIRAEIAPGDARTVGLRLLAAPDREEETLLLYDRSAGILTLDRERASLSPDAHRGAHATDLPLAPDEPLSLRVFLDGSVVEVYADTRRCLTSRVYPTRADSRGVALIAPGGTATCTALEAWEMAAALPEPAGEP
jgi:beta-fructofuranosidase